MGGAPAQQQDGKSPRIPKAVHRVHRFHPDSLARTLTGQAGNLAFGSFVRNPQLPIKASPMTQKKENPTHVWHHHNQVPTTAGKTKAVSSNSQSGISPTIARVTGSPTAVTVKGNRI